MTERTIADIRKSAENIRTCLDMIAELPTPERRSEVLANCIAMFNLEWFLDVELLLGEIDRLRGATGELIIRVKPHEVNEPALTDPEEMGEDIVETFNAAISPWEPTGNAFGPVEFVSAEWSREHG